MNTELVYGFHISVPYEFETEEALYQKVEEFAYVDYNHARPHSYNGYLRHGWQRS